jgi:UDP-N-acetylglucosamine transferase subunit ALG13
LIFVTVGTHEQCFDRLLKKIDQLIEKNIIKEKVFAQIGYTKYLPQNYDYDKLISYNEMDSFVKESRIIITHGGPGSIFHPIQYNKIPIVVPRNPEFNEHVDNHQILFTKRLEKNKKVIGVYNIDDLDEVIYNYDTIVSKFNTISVGDNKFIEKFDQLIKTNLNLKE